MSLLLSSIEWIKMTDKECSGPRIKGAFPTIKQAKEFCEKPPGCGCISDRYFYSICEGRDVRTAIMSGLQINVTAWILRPANEGIHHNILIFKWHTSNIIKSK